MKLERDFLSYVYGAGRDWTAVCVDLDLAVEASSQREAIEKIEAVVCSYIEDALKEEPRSRDRLLKRQSPIGLRLSLWLQYRLFLLRRSKPHKNSVSTVAVPCHG